MPREWIIDPISEMAFVRRYLLRLLPSISFLPQENRYQTVQLSSFTQSSTTRFEEN